MPAGDPPPTVTLERVLEVVGESLLKPLSLPRGSDVTVSDVSVYEPADPVPEAGLILLAVGLNPAEPASWELSSQCRLAGAPVIVIKERGGDLDGSWRSRAARLPSRSRGFSPASPVNQNLTVRMGTA